MADAGCPGIVTSGFACQLERELIAANQEVERLKEELVFYKKSLGRVADLFDISHIMMVGASSKERPEETYVDILIRLIEQQSSKSKGLI